MKKYVLLLGLLIPVVSVLAQETSVGKSIFSVHAGPSWYFGKMIGITNNISSVRLNSLPDLSIRVDVIKTLMTKVPTRY